MNPDEKRYITGICIVVGLPIALSMIAWGILSLQAPATPAAYQCPPDDSKYLEEHIVTFVAINADGQPCEDVLIRCTQGSGTQDVVTRADGSCAVLVYGDQECALKVYNKGASEREFRLYPVQSCYPLILET